MMVKELIEALLECDPFSEVLGSSKERITEVVEVINRQNKTKISYVRLF